MFKLKTDAKMQDSVGCISMIGSTWSGVQELRILDGAKLEACRDGLSEDARGCDAKMMPR